MPLKKIDLFFDLSKSFDLLNKIKNIKNGTISSNEFSKSYNVLLEPSNKGIKFKLLIDSFYFEQDKWIFKELEITQNGLKLRLPYLYLNKITDNAATGNISAFEYGNFSNEEYKYHRLVLPINKNVNFIFSIENVIIDYNYK
jgi:hypothetical protein